MPRARKDEMLRQERQRLIRLVKQHLLQCGGAVVDEARLPETPVTFVLATKAGTLHVTPYGNWIACRFLDPAAAAPLCDGRLNSYSGKWNFHFSRVTAEQALIAFAAELTRVL